MNIVDQLSRTKTKEEIAERKQRRQSQQVEKTLQPVQSPPAPQIQVQPEPQAQQKPQPEVQSPAVNGTSDEERGRSHAASVTASSAPKDIDTTKLAPKCKSCFHNSRISLQF